jgi:hypothetical protein
MGASVAEMSDEFSTVPLEEIRPEPSDVRFGMRGLLVTMTGVAVATAVFGSLLRGMEPERRFDIATTWGLCGLVVLGCVGYYARLRFQLERLGGSTIFVLVPRSILGIPARPWMTILLGSSSAGLGVIFLAGTAVGISTELPGSGFVLRMFACAFSGVLISIGITNMWWNRTLQLREHGVLRGVQLLWWSHVAERHWDKKMVILKGVDQRHWDRCVRAFVDADQRDAVIELLRQRCRTGC